MPTSSRNKLRSWTAIAILFLALLAMVVTLLVLVL